MMGAGAGILQKPALPGVRSSQLTRKGDVMRENWDRQREAGSSSAQGLGGVSKKGPVMTGRAKESPLQSGPADSGDEIYYPFSGLPSLPQTLAAKAFRPHPSEDC